MYKDISIDGKKVKLKITGGTLCRYKEQFGVDYSAELNKVSEIKNSFLKLRAMEITGARMIWAMAKTADKNISAPADWIDSFENFPVQQILDEINPFVLNAFKAGYSDEQGDGEPITAEKLTACCFAAGLTMADIDSMSPGFLINVISEYCDIKSGKEKDTVRMATQADIDAF
ncbi:MAG: hypothetical protein ACI4EU_05905 [Butyrivibrio sp.]